MMYHCMPIDLRSPLDAKLLEHVCHAELHELVDHGKKHSKERHRGNDHPGGRHHVFAARPGDLFRLHANVMPKFTRVGDCTRNLFRQLRARSALGFINGPFHRTRSRISIRSYVPRCARYSIISVTARAPTVWPPSRIANRRPFSSATGVINITSQLTLSPGITIPTPAGSFISPVTSVVRK